MRSSVTLSALVSYGLLAIPLAFAGFPLYVLAPDFYGTTHGVPLGSLGVVLMILRLFDAFQDPFIGHMSDRHRSSIHLWVMVFLFLLWLSIHALFNHLYGPPLVWFALMMTIAVTSYSFLAINLSALGSLWTRDPHDQTRIASSREGFGLLGLVLAVSLPSSLALVLTKNSAYLWFSIFLLGLCLLGGGFFLRWWRRHAPILPRQSHTIDAMNFFSVLSDLSQKTKKLLGIHLVNMLASSIPSVLVVFFIRDLLGLQSYTGLFFTLYFISGALMMPGWKRISHGIGKESAWLLSMFVAVSSFIWTFTLGPGDMVAYAMICFLSGASLGADLILPPSLLADDLHANKKQHAASVHYALLTLVTKMALAGAAGLSLPLLEKAGFSPGDDNSAHALMALRGAYALIPCALKVVSGLLLWRYYIAFKTKKEG